MIIKVMTRKEPSFRQLIAYIDRDARDTRYSLTHNLLGTDADARAAEFEANAGLLRKHQNGTVLFHDIVSITRSTKLGLERQKEILEEIVETYVRRRADGHLVYGGLHEHQGQHLHYHLIISANPLGNWKRAHLSKPELRTLQADMEARVLKLYPDLEQSVAMGRKAKGPNLSQPGQELRRRTGKVPERQRVVDTLTKALTAATDRDDLFRRLTDQRLELYRRGKSVGVRDLDSGRNHRLATLGLTDVFKAASVRIEATAQNSLRTAIVPPQSPLRSPQKNASPTPSPSPQEPPVDLIQMALNGLTTLADALSISPGTIKPVEDETNRVKRAVARTLPPKQKKSSKQIAQPTSAPSTSAMTPSSTRAIPVETKNVRHSVNAAIDPDLTPDQVRVINDVRHGMPPNEVQVLNDVRQALVDDRLREITEAREAQERQAGDERGTSLNR